MRVERPERPRGSGTASAVGPGEPQVVSYRFAQSDLEALRDAIVRARAAST